MFFSCCGKHSFINQREYNFTRIQHSAKVKWTLILTVDFVHKTAFLQNIYNTVPVPKILPLKVSIRTLSTFESVYLRTEYFWKCLSAHWVLLKVSISVPSTFESVYLHTEYFWKCLSAHWVFLKVSICTLSVFERVYLHTECFWKSICTLSTFESVHLHTECFWKSICTLSTHLPILINWHCLDWKDKTKQMIY